MRILLIEDEKDYAETLTDIFSENLDHEFLWVKSLEDTERAIKDKKWDIILSDVHLDFHPERILDFYETSSLSHKTPLIFLTAERNTKLSFDLIEKGDFPVVSKFEIDEDILAVVRNYIDLCYLIKKQEDVVEEVSFRKFIARYINEKRYKNSELSSSLSGWIDQEKFLFSKLQAKKKDSKNKVEDTQFSSIKAGYVKIASKDFKIIEFSPLVESLTEYDDLKGMPLNLVMNKIIDTEELYGVLHRLLDQKINKRVKITLPAIGSKGAIQYDIYIKKRNGDASTRKSVDIEVIQNRDREVEKAELFNLKETNKLLLQEVHHRVNNNLNVITSLLNLRIMSAGSEEIEVYQTVLEQITPIISVYDQLFLTKKISSVNLKIYIEDLVKKIFNRGQQPDIIEKLSFDDDGFELNLNQIITVGLLLNEIYQVFRENNISAELSVSKQHDVVNLIFQAENISKIIDEKDSLSNQQDNFILNAILNKLAALISVRGKDKILIRFKKVTKRGGGSNLID